MCCCIDSNRKERWSDSHPKAFERTKHAQNLLWTEGENPFQKRQSLEIKDWTWRAKRKEPTLPLPASTRAGVVFVVCSRPSAIWSFLPRLGWARCPGGSWVRMKLASLWTEQLLLTASPGAGSWIIHITAGFLLRVPVSPHPPPPLYSFLITSGLLSPYSLTVLAIFFCLQGPTAL